MCQTLPGRKRTGCVVVYLFDTHELWVVRGLLPVSHQHELSKLHQRFMALNTQGMPNFRKKSDREKTFQYKLLICVNFYTFKKPLKTFIK